MSEFLTILAAGGYGVLSALIPLFNAELYVVAMAKIADPPVGIAGVLVLTVGTVIGKIIIFEGAKRGSSRFVGEGLDERTHRAIDITKDTGWFTRWIRGLNRIMLNWLQDKWLGPLTTLAASLVGVPPLFLVAVMAGIARQNLVMFISAVFVGRLVRFSVLAWPFIYAWH